jgi:hypothetical protein
MKLCKLRTKKSLNNGPWKEDIFQLKYVSNEGLSTSIQVRPLTVDSLGELSDYINDVLKPYAEL